MIMYSIVFHTCKVSIRILILQQQAGTDKNKEAEVETIPDNTSLMDFTSQKDLAETALDKVVPDDDQNIIVVNESNVVKQACSSQAASAKEKSPDESLPNQGTLIG